MPRFPWIALATCLIWASPAQSQWVANGVPVCTANGTQQVPLGCPDGSGGVFIGWTDGRGSEAEIFVLRLTAAGTRAPGWPVNGAWVRSGPGNGFLNQMLEDGAGGAFLLWGGGPFDSSVHLQRLVGTGQSAPGWPDYGLEIRPAGGARIVLDGDGGVLVVWMAANHFYAQRITSAGAIAPGWPTDGLPVCVENGAKSGMVLVPDGAGGALMAWGERRSGDLHDLYATHIEGSGVIAPGWITDGTPFCTVYAVKYLQDGAPDGNGGAFFTWYDYRLGARVFVHHLTGQGERAPGWPVDGLAATTSPGFQESSRCVADGAGGVIVMWNDYDTGLKARRLTGGGDPVSGWPFEGVVVGDAPANPADASMVSDGSGGMIAVWEDWRGSTPDVYAQRVSAFGTAGWGDGGMAVCVAGDHQMDPAVIATAEGVAVVTWQDYRTGESSIYAQRVPPEAMASVEEPAAGELSLRIGPNPTSAGADIVLHVSTPDRGSIEVLDITGRRVRGIVENHRFGSGTQRFSWRGDDDGGASMPAGVYVVRARIGDRLHSARLVVTR